MIVAFIDAYKLVFGVEPICRVLRDHNVPIAPSTYYAYKKRPRCARAVSDERLVPLVKAEHEDNFGCTAHASCDTRCGAKARTSAAT